MKEKTVIGLLIIAMGVIILGNNLFVWNFNLFFEGWWTLIIIIPSVIRLFKGKVQEAIFGIVVGIFLLLATRDVISWTLFAPIIIILIGVSILFSSNRGKVVSSKSNYNAIFGSNGGRIIEHFLGTNITSLFGQVELDLRQATIQPDACISCMVLFGEVEISVSSDVVVIINGTPVFGEINNRTKQSGGIQLIVEYTCIFGEITIRN